MNAGKAVVIMGLSALVPVAGGACTGFYVGRKVSSDGTTLIARTVDSHPPTDAFATEVVRPKKSMSQVPVEQKN